MSLADFHPAVVRWFTRQYGEAPTSVQSAAWPAIRRGETTLIAAPTGSGKTLAAFLAVIDELLRKSINLGLADETHILYISPLKALSNDIQKNLEIPLAGIRDALLETGKPDVLLRTAVRSGDTPASERARMRRAPPHILVTTPESLYILLTSESGRRMLGSVRTVIVDEIHALAGNKRGAHLALSLERLAALCRESSGHEPVRIGLSATQKPIELMAKFLTGARDQPCNIIDTGYSRQRDLAIEVTSSELEAVMAAEVWKEVYDRLAELIATHRTTLIFVNTRRLAERAAHHLAERLGEAAVTAHHGSLAREHRLDAEQRLKSGKLRALVATSSLELGIDIGEINLVCQLGSPRAIAAFLQRVGRSGHSVGGMPKGRLFPLTRDDLAECAALLDAVRHGELDRIRIPEAPLDVLAQQVVAEVATREWREVDLFEAFCCAWPYRELTRETFTAVVRMLAAGFSTRRGRRGAHLYHDAINGRLRARRGARTTAITNGGAIPDQFDFDVILQPQGQLIGNLNEDFAFESLSGDIFQLGNSSYRMLKIEQGKVHVEDAHGEPPNIPFWFGEAPGRTDELSQAVSRLRSGITKRLVSGPEIVKRWLQDELAMPPAAARQLTDYYAAAYAALGALPTQEIVILERFFDEAGDMHVVIHAPFGSRVNRAWGLALRKRFCRKFNFELQAAALEDSLVLSLGPTHSFALAEVANYINSASVRTLLVQALLAAPMFATHWRWNANIALAVLRNRHGKRLPAQFQRSDAEDLVAVIFPDQLACLENISGDREIPDHPLVEQTLNDCLHRVMDIEGLEAVLAGLEQGAIRVVARDLTAPSALSEEILSARPYAFLDDAPAEERRTLAIQRRRFADPASAAELGQLDPRAIEKICTDVWPTAASPDELHDSLQWLGFITVVEGTHGTAPIRKLGKPEEDWRPHFSALVADRRATRFDTEGGESLWIAAERVGEFLALYPDALLTPALSSYTEGGTRAPEGDAALVEIIRSRLEGLGPVTAAQLAAPLGLPPTRIDAALLILENEGFAIRGQFSAQASGTEWCERRLLARIHRATLTSLRSEIKPVPPAQFMRFLFHWQRVTDPGEGPDALATVLDQMEGLPVPAAAWEADVLPARLVDYSPHDLDQLCGTGRYAWLRLNARRDSVAKGAERTRGRPSTPVRATPITFLARLRLGIWRALNPLPNSGELSLSADARRVSDALRTHGALFFDDILALTGLLHTQAETAVGELVAVGQVSSDNFSGLRALLLPAHRRPGFAQNRPRRRLGPGIASAGRWTPLEPLAASQQEDNLAGSIENIARTLLRRYGVIFRRLLDRETNVPAWRDLAYTYRRMEARGEIRGGRFVDGFSGEQFALADAVTSMRNFRHQDPAQLVVVAATDPLNLTGIITPGERIPAQLGYRILFRDGIPAATMRGHEIRFYVKYDTATEQGIRTALLTHSLPRHTRAIGT